MGLGERNVADEAPDGPAAVAGAVGAVVALLDLWRQRVDGAKRGQQLHEPHRVLREQSADQWRRGPTDHPGEQGHLREGGIEVDEPLNIGRSPHREAGADRAAPVVHHERESADPQLLEQVLEVGDAVGRREVDILGLIGEATADVIGHDHPEVLPQARDQVAKQKPPGRIAVQADDDGAAPLVDVVHAVALRCPRPRSTDRREP